MPWPLQRGGALTAGNITKSHGETSHWEAVKEQLLPRKPTRRYETWENPVRAFFAETQIGVT